MKTENPMNVVLGWRDFCAGERSVDPFITRYKDAPFGLLVPPMNIFPDYAGTIRRDKDQPLLDRLKSMYDAVSCSEHEVSLCAKVGSVFNRKPWEMFEVHSATKSINGLVVVRASHTHTEHSPYRTDLISGAIYSVELMDTLTLLDAYSAYIKESKCEQVYDMSVMVAMALAEHFKGRDWIFEQDKTAWEAPISDLLTSPMP